MTRAAPPHRSRPAHASSCRTGGRIEQARRAARSGRLRSSSSAGARCARLAVGGDIGFAEVLSRRRLVDARPRRAARVRRRQRGRAARSSRASLPRDARTAAPRLAPQHASAAAGATSPRTTISATTFYRQWLDASMNYSSALYRRPDRDAGGGAARQARPRRRAARPEAAARRVLEIGCGWGALAERLARDTAAASPASRCRRSSSPMRSERLRQEVARARPTSGCRTIATSAAPSTASSRSR